MKLSLKWLKEYVDINATPEEIDVALTNLGIEVEKIEKNRDKYQNFVIAQVLKSDFVEGSDHLHYCEVTDGTNNYNLICGAPNVDVNQKVVLGTAGAVLPANGLKLEKKKIRGLVSNGMICSKYELGINDDHSGIWVLPEDTQIGTSLVDFLDADDTFFEISVTPNRGDCLSHIGIARELSAYFNLPIKYPHIPQELYEKNGDIHSLAKVEIIDSEKNPRYVAKLVKNVKIQESPDWLKKKIVGLGLRPINNVVDITNFVLFEMNQPLHAFDYDKIANHHIIIKTAEDNSKFTTLDGKERTLDGNMLTICDAEKPIAIAGVMGGQNSEITDTTKNVLIESAYFNPVSIRRTSKKLGLSSDSSYRFERGVDWARIDTAANRAAQLIAELGGGEIVSGIIDEFPNQINRPEIELRFERTRKIIGYNIDDNKLVDLLERLNFEIVSRNENSVIVLAPTYRSDILIEVDLIEEIARLFGYDNIAPQFVSQIDTSSSPIPSNLSVPPLRKKIKTFLINRGLNEVLTQNMVEPAIAKKFSEDLVEISNPLGEELSIMRPSILPSMLKTIRNNERMGNQILKLFEIGKIFTKTNEKTNFIDGILESDNLIIGFSGYETTKQWGIKERKLDFYDVKGIISELFQVLKINNLKFKQTTDDIVGFSNNKLLLVAKNQEIGIIGEVSKEFLYYYELTNQVYVAIIKLDEVYKFEIKQPKFKSLTSFPSVYRDLAFVVRDEIQVGEVLDNIIAISGNLLNKCNLFDIYKGKPIEAGFKSIAFSLEFSSSSKTLTDEEIEPILKKIIDLVQTKYQGVLRTI